MQSGKLAAYAKHTTVTLAEVRKAYKEHICRDFPADERKPLFMIEKALIDKYPEFEYGKALIFIFRQTASGFSFKENEEKLEEFTTKGETTFTETVLFGFPALHQWMNMKKNAFLVEGINFHFVKTDGEPYIVEKTP